METSEFLKEVELLATAYPKAFPTDKTERVAIGALWYDHFNHIPAGLFAKASRWCMKHKQFLSIAALWESIIAVANVPSAYETKGELTGLPAHPIAKRIYKVLDLHWEDSELNDFAFEREYKRAREWWVEEIMKPENVGLLTGAPLLASGEPGGA